MCACEVLTTRPLDRERTPFYSLQVRCEDAAGAERRLTETGVQVNVVDVNDNSPVFTAQTYRGTLVENNYIGASVLQASSTICTATRLTRFARTQRQHGSCRLHVQRANRTGFTATLPRFHHHHASSSDAVSK